MNTRITAYLAASGSPPSIEQDIAELRQATPPHIVASPTGLLRWLKEEQHITYDWNTFAAHEVVQNKKGNCLGLPLLVAALLSTTNDSPTLYVGVSPQDAVWSDEHRVLRAVRDSTSYTNPCLAHAVHEHLIHRFTPLEHLLLDDNGRIVETTSDNTTAPPFESLRKITFDQALSFVYYERTHNALQNGDYQTAASLAQEGIKHWKDNRELHGLLAMIAHQSFDDAVHSEETNRFLALGNGDSLYNAEKYELTGDRTHLEKALQAYPAHASAIALKAETVNDNDPREATFLYSIASQLFARSAVLDLGRLYMNHAHSLAHLFGRKTIVNTLRGFAQHEGEFDYHMALFDLTGDAVELGEACEAIETPRQKLTFLMKSRGTTCAEESALQEMDRTFAQSALYQKAKKSLNRLKTRE